MEATSRTPVSSGRTATCESIARLEFDNLQRWGTYTRLFYEEISFTNEEEIQHAGKLARVLKERGIHEGERVILIMPNIPQLTASFQAIWMLGAVPVPVMPQWSVAEIAYALHSSGARSLLTAPALSLKVAEAAKQVRTPQDILVFGASDVGGVNVVEEVASALPVDTPANRRGEDIALLLYTSGTTARPKGVVLTHSNLYAGVRASDLMNTNLPRYPVIQSLPLAHIFGMLMLLVSRFWGMSSVLIRQFDPTVLFGAIERHRAGMLPVVPTMLNMLLHHPDRSGYDLSSLQRVIVGGAALPEKLRTSFMNAVPCRVDQGYGLSETVAVGTFYGPEDSYRSGSAGRAHPGTEVHIVDDKDCKLPPRRVGEICLVGQNITPGYWMDEDATADAFRGGRFHTGDIGYLDEDGYLYLTSRKKDLIIKGGENISPSEIEEPLYAHPAIAEAVVVGIPDQVFGEDICAVVQLQPGSFLSEDDIRGYLSGMISKFKLPARVVFQSALPKHSTGKIDRRSIRELVLKV